MSHPALPPGFVNLPVYAEGQSIPGPSGASVLSSDGLRAFHHINSGLRVVLFAAPGPLVSATIVVGTQPLSNAGHPHTLEHIIFLGSHNYPQRGYLDNLACRCLARGTNAWTETEYTAYTAKTAGFQGFAHLLPVYLDHILRPKINDAAFASEVYHVRPDAKEAGVVFCEMQARENTESDISDRAVRAALFEGTPLALECGGLCSDIRTLTNEDIVQFHRTQYCGENVTVIVGGNEIDPNVLLNSVKPLLDEISSAPGYQRGHPQWRTPIDLKPLPPVSRRIIPFPCPDNDMGTVILAWRGPGINDRLTAIAIEVLLSFLDAYVWSPLQQEFVETEDQLASEIDSSIDVFLDVSAIVMSFSGVQHVEDEDDDDEAVDDLQETDNAKDCDTASVESIDQEKESFLTSGRLERQVMAFLSDIVKKGELPGGLSAMQAAIKKEVEVELTELESDSHSSIPHRLLEEVIYGSRDSLTIGEESRGFLAHFAELEQKTEEYWIELLSRLLVEAPRVEVVMVPDTSLAQNNADDERTSQVEREAKLRGDEVSIQGQDGNCASPLESCKFAADIFPPIPSTLTISRWPYIVTRGGAMDYGCQSVTLETDFVHCSIFLDTSRLSIAQRTFLPVLCELLPSCDILLEDGSYIAYTDHARSVSELTVSTDGSGIHMGYSSEMAHQCTILHFAAMPSSFADAAEVLFQTFFCSEVTAERVSAVSQTLHANAVTDIRDGDVVLGAAVPMIPFLEGGERWSSHLPNYTLANILGSFPLLSFMADEFTKKKPRKQVQRKIVRQLRDCLHSLQALPGSDIFIQVTARDPKPAHEVLSSLWKKHRGSDGRDGSDPKPSGNGPAAGELPLSRRIFGRLSDVFPERSIAKIIGITGVDSTSIDIRVDSPVFIGHADWSALTVCTEMLCRMEGPLCTAVRGTGLAYGVHIENSSWLGQLSASVYESSNPAAAWDAVCACLDAFRQSLNETHDDSCLVDLETAKASLLYSLNSKRSTPERIADGAIARTALGVPAGPMSDRALEEAIERVSLDEVGSVFDKHVARLRQERSRLVVVTCGAGVSEDIVAAFSHCKNAIRLENCPVESLHPRQVVEVVQALKAK
ncbi:unnamed protein product [Chondrus crispus]|uniref:Peptidase M16 N-terminal domain-containing protein n=1 Tax=Chondrus crispus TaxID=2769 RepID=R7QD58_CHOCR|nr:unnamed protein product [Chondrus crispus]CDF36442.1 unnamed protein product [Chondrus crispus]|eukprot:XP_005716261.1 unnamed protein product [Chondrus crispus]